MVLLALLVTALQSSPAAPVNAPAARIEVHVDERIEFLMALARVAGFEEYRMPAARSPYSAEVDEYFGPLAGEPALATLRRLRREQGISYDAIPSLAVHLGPLPELEERIPFDASPERLDARWGGAQARDFLAQLRDLARLSEAQAFFAEHRALYQAAEQRLAARLAESRALPWFDAFLGARPEARYAVIPGLLAGGGNYGTGVRFPDGRPEEITPVLGCAAFDAQGLPVFDASVLPLLVHELAHTYTNPIVDRFETELAGAGGRIHATCAKVMERQGYGTWKTMMYETFVRACVVRCRLETEGAEAGRAQAEEERERGFTWVPALAQALDGYARDRAKYPTLERYVPDLLGFFERTASELEAATTSGG